MSATASKNILVISCVCDQHDPLPLLISMKARVTDLKATVLVIPSKVSAGLLDRYAKYDWIQVGSQGYHGAKRECLVWPYEEAFEKMQEIFEFVPTKIYAAMNFEGNKEVARAAKSLGVIMVDNPEHAAVWGLYDLPRYVFGVNPDLRPVHVKAQDAAKLSDELSADDKFDFVSDHLSKPHEYVDYGWEQLALATRYKEGAVDSVGRLWESVDKKLGSFVDFGGNDGTGCGLALDLGADRVLNIDENRMALAYSRFHYKVDSRYEDLLDLPFEDNQFDWGHCAHVLEHLPDMKACIKEMSRVCKKGIYWRIPVETKEAFDNNPSHLHRKTFQEWLDLLGGEEICRTEEEIECLVRF